MSMIMSCPAESDPRDKVADFISDPSIGSIGGLRTDGMEFLVELITEEIRTQEPDSIIINLDRDYLCDNNIDFARDLEKVMIQETSEGTKINWIVIQDLPVLDWQKSLDKIKDRDTQVFFFTNACRQVPCCFKLISNAR